MIFLFVLLFALPLGAMQQTQDLKTRKLYAQDFKDLGVEFTSILHTSLDRVKILPSKPLKLPMNWKILLEAQRSELKKHIVQQYQAPIYIKYINDRVGFGVFADAPIKEFDTICEYTGHLCVEQDVENENVDLNFSIDVGSYYHVDGKNKQLYVDAKKAGNFSRFMNHSYLNNVSSLSVYNEQDGLWHVVMCAEKDINKDDQLLTNYGEGYWKSRGIEPIDLTANP